MSILVKQRKKISCRFAQLALFVFICFGFMGQGCPFMEMLLGELTSVVQEEKKAGETFNVVVAEFEVRNCDEGEWFCESKIAKKVKDAIAEGVKMAQESEPSIKLAKVLSTSEAEPLYIALKSKSEKKRRDALSAIISKYNGNALIFGFYKGDDYDLEIKPFIYSKTRDALEKGNFTAFKRIDPDFPRKIANLIKGLLLNVFKN